MNIDDFTDNVEEIIENRRTRKKIVEEKKTNVAVSVLIIIERYKQRSLTTTTQNYVEY